MPGRTPDYSVSTFKPLSLQEIMMVPLAKQKMHDAVLDANDAEQELTTKVSSYDKERADGILQGFKSRASSIADGVLSRGVDASDIRNMKSLRSDTKKEFTDGMLGKLQSNYASQSEYLKALSTQTGRQGGYSAQEAQAFARKNLKDFGSSFDEDGNFKSFQGREMSKYYDEDKFIKEAIDSVAEQVEEGAYTLTKIGGLDALHDAFQKGTVTKKDFNKIMLAIKTKAQTNNSFKAHLNQMAEIYGEKEDPLDFGNFDTREEPVLDRAGNPVLDKKTGKPKTQSITEFIPGKGRFGIKAAGLGAVGAYRNIDIDTKILKNEVRAAMFKNNYSKDKLTRMYAVHKGELKDVTSGDIDEIYSLNEEFEGYLDGYKTRIENLNPQIKEFEDRKAKGETLTIEEQDELGNLLSERKSMLKNYSQAKIDYDNTKNYIDQLQDESYEDLGKTEKGTIKINQVLEKHKGDPVIAAIEDLDVSFEDIESLLPKFELKDLQDADKYSQIAYEAEKEGDTKKSQTYLQMAQEAQNRYDKSLRSAAFSLLGKEYGVLKSVDPQGTNFGRSFEKGYYNDMLRERRGDIIQDRLDQTKQAVPYRKVSMSESSKYSSKIFSDFNTMTEETINPAQTLLAGKRGNKPGTTLQTFMKSKDFIDHMGEAPEGFEFQRSFTIDGYDDKGRFYDEIVIRNAAMPTVQYVLQVVADQNSKDQAMDLYADLKKSKNMNNVLDGEKGEANAIFMPSIKRAMLRYNKSGTLQVPLLDGSGNETDEVEFKKVTKQTSLGPKTYYNVTLFGIPVKYGNRSDLKGEQEIALGLMQAMSQINSIIKGQEEQN